jgi:hypothetical protein
MALVKRLVKGSPLTYAEADGNLTYLDNKVTGSVGLIPVFDSVNTVTGSSVLSQAGSNVLIDGNLTVTGDLTAMQYIVSSSVSHFTESFSSGSTRFGDSLTDTHQFTGSVLITGSSQVIGTQSITGSLTISGSTFHNGFLSSSDGAYFSNQITVTHMTIGHGTTENNTNLAMGWLTMPVLASGLRNTVVGASSGFFLQSGSDNTVFGNNALVSLVSGSGNTAIGQNAGFFASGSGNVFIGHQAGQLQTSGDNKLWIANSSTLTPLIKGDFSTGLLQLYTTGSTQITGSLIVSNAVTASYFTGDGSGLTNLPGGSSFRIITGSVTASVDIGDKLFSLTSASVNFGQIDIVKNNVSFGQNTIWSGSIGIYNTAFGYGTLQSNTEGYGNVAIGYAALNNNTTGDTNVALGGNALEFNATGSDNTAVGTGALNFNVNSDNIALGSSAGLNNTIGIGNTFVGTRAGRLNVTGSYNVFIGLAAGTNEPNSNKLYIANSSTSTPLIKGDFSTGELRFQTPSGFYVTGGLSIRDTGNKSEFQVNTDIKQLILSDNVDPFNQFQVALSGSSFLNSSPQVQLTSGDKGFNIDGTVKILSTGTQITGSLTITGSSVFSGSATGVVNSLPISSNTASLDLSRGNFFTLQLVGSTDTYINPSNIQSGQTVCVLINTIGSGTVSFPASVLQASGSAYVPTTTTGKDIITLVSFDSSNLYLVNVKNLI